MRVLLGAVGPTAVRGVALARSGVGVIHISINPPGTTPPTLRRVDAPPAVQEKLVGYDLEIFQFEVTGLTPDRTHVAQFTRDGEEPVERAFRTLPSKGS